MRQKFWLRQYQYRASVTFIRRAVPVWNIKKDKFEIWQFYESETGHIGRIVTFIKAEQFWKSFSDQNIQVQVSSPLAYTDMTVPGPVTTPLHQTNNLKP